MELNDTFEWNGRSIACGRAGTGPDVVFCHGTPFSSRVWSRYADALAERYTVHLWDMPGYGQSSKRAEDAVDFGAQTDAFVALLDHWGLDRPHVVAHDFGGTVAVQATVNKAREYASLLLVDAVVIPPTGSPLFRFVGQHPDVLPGLPPYVHEAIVRAYIPSAAHHVLPERHLAELVAPWLGAEGQPAFYRQIAQYDEAYLHDNEAKLGNVTARAHVVWAEQDAWIPLQAGRRIAELLPDAGITTIPDAGHLVQYDAPVALTSILQGWLADAVA